MNLTRLTRVWFEQKLPAVSPSRSSHRVPPKSGLGARTTAPLTLERQVQQLIFLELVVRVSGTALPVLLPQLTVDSVWSGDEIVGGHEPPSKAALYSRR